MVTLLICYFTSYNKIYGRSSGMDLKQEEQDFEGKWLRGQNNHHTNVTKHIVMLTYNIWFGKFRMFQRMKGIGKIITDLKPNVITLNEVTAENIFLLKSQDWFHKYKLVPPDLMRGDSYFVVLLTNFPTKSWKIRPFDNSRMGRTLSIVELGIPSGSFDIALTIATSHFESMAFNTKQREWQLKKSIEMLSLSNNVCLMGDLNLELEVDGEVVLPPPWYDAWLSLPGNSHDNGYTWDPSINSMNNDGSTKNRFDRVLCKLLDFTVHSMKVVGKKQLSPGVFPSDHFGLLTVLTLQGKSAGHASLADTTKTKSVVFKRPPNWE